MFTPSDFMLIACLVPITLFALSFGIGSPWYRSALGWVMLLFALSVLALLALIVFGIVFGAAIDEPYRLIVASGVFLASTAKLVILTYERRQGRSSRNTPIERQYTRDKLNK